MGVSRKRTVRVSIIIFIVIAVLCVSFFSLVWWFYYSWDKWEKQETAKFMELHERGNAIRDTGAYVPITVDKFIDFDEYVGAELTVTLSDGYDAAYKSYISVKYDSYVLLFMFWDLTPVSEFAEVHDAGDTVTFHCCITNKSETTKEIRVAIFEVVE